MPDRSDPTPDVRTPERREATSPVRSPRTGTPAERLRDAPRIDPSRSIAKSPERPPSARVPERRVLDPSRDRARGGPVLDGTPSERVRTPTRSSPNELASTPEQRTTAKTPPLNRLERSPQIDPSRQPSRETASNPAQPGSKQFTKNSARTQSHDFDCNDHNDCHDIDTHCSFWWSNPCNRFVCWGGSFGCQSGFLFCGSSVYWYWWWPGYAPCYRPYSYYWSPYCNYLPAYYPSYSTVTYVHDYYDDEYYDSYAEPHDEATEPSGAPPPDAAALLDAGWQQFKSGAYFDAVESFRQAVLADPDDAQAKVAFAQALFAIGNYPDAAFLLRRTVEVLPDWPVLGGDPRAYYAEADDHAEQMVALRGFLERMPAEPAATLVLGVQSYFTGDLTAAREAFSLLAALDPEDLVAKRFLSQLGPVPPAPPASKDGR